MNKQPNGVDSMSGYQLILGMRALRLVVGVGLVLSAPLTLASAPTNLLDENACSACHAVDKAIVGPAYSAVAEKYANDDGAKAHLIQSIRKGGSGTWGPVPMPPQPDLTDDDLATIVDWLLAGAKP